MNKLLIICGPTATGKTALGIKLAKEFNGEILSADSRQVYRGMDVGTGKDVGDSRFKIYDLGFKNKELTFGYYTVDGVRIWGLDIVGPDYPFNVADYVEYSRMALDDIWRRNKLPIVVGGTGLYIRSLLKPPLTLEIPPDEKLRRELESYPAEKLQQRLRLIDKSKWEAMNESDRINPRRLVRAIEVATFHRVRSVSDFARGGLECSRPPLGQGRLDTLKIGLTLFRKKLYRRIDERVERRLKSGMETEVRRLLASGLSQSAQSLSGTGYHEFVQKLPSPDAKLSKGDLDEIVRRWEFTEHGYARRQLTWFRKDKGVVWFDISRPKLEENVVKAVSKWYTQTV